MSGSEPALIHYTEGGPWFAEYRTCPFSDEWVAEYLHMIHGGSKD